MGSQTVLIADDDQALATAIAIRCKDLGLHALTCPDGITAYQSVVEQPPDLLILDLRMPGADGLYLYEALARETSLAPIPAIILTGDSDEATVQQCERLGAHYVWKGLDTWSELKPLVLQLLNLESPTDNVQATSGESQQPNADAEAKSRAPRVLVVDDDPDVSKAIKIRLKAYGVEVFRAFSGMQGYWRALKEQPDAIVMDYRMPEGYGSYLLGRLQKHPLTKDVPVIILTGVRAGGRKNLGLERELLRLGATAFLTKPLDFRRLVKELRRHMHVAEGQVPSILAVTAAP